MHILSVTQLNRHIRNILEQDVGEVCVEGEISNLTKPASGHFYFTLKDATAQIRCVFFRNRHTSGHTRLQNGQLALARGKLSLYEARGDYQLIIEELREAGQGDLNQLFELLKVKLAALGLFEAARKKKLPRFPHSIGVITSATGAALRDILTTLARRFPQACVLIYPSDVQGKSAAPQLVAAIQRANIEKRCDVIILARGGGSIEDLWAFNDETLAYTIAESLIPIVSGVGHETDFTLADFVADLRAATPTAAAEAVTPDQLELMSYFQTMCDRLLAVMQRCVQHRVLLLRHEIQKITSPGQLIATYWQTLDYLERHLFQAVQYSFTQRQHRLHLMIARLQAQNPQLLFLQATTQISRLENQLFQAMNNYLRIIKQRFHSQLVTLHAVSPLATLDRGYALVTHNQRLLFDSKDAGVGDVVQIRLARGRLICEVLEHAEPV
ncbi:MAG: exodeoxyribonuclease VII large subunit [Legionellaceae bacterium]|nr:exodeoxyribonuclease VII large subunit [Legionellaceae bacterium]